MKRIMSIVLIVLTVFVIGTISFADMDNTTYHEEQDRGFNQSEERLQVDESNNLNFSVAFEEELVPLIASLIDLLKNKI